MNRPIDNDYLYPDEKSDGAIIGHLDHEAYIEALEKYVDHLEQMNFSGDIQNVSVKMSKGKQITLDILEQVRDHYLNTLTIDETDRDEFEKVEKAIEWVKQATDLSLVLPIQNAALAKLFP